MTCYNDGLAVTLMNTDLVRLSLLPHCAPFPEQRDNEAAKQWADETIKIIEEHPGVAEMRAQRAAFDVIALDWPEGLEALGKRLSKADHSWWTPADISKNPFARAATQNSLKIVEAMVDPQRLGKYVKISTLAGTLLGVSDVRHFDNAILDAIVQGVCQRREQFIEHDQKKLKNAVVSQLLKGGNADLVAEIYGIENIPRIENAWLAKGIEIIANRLKAEGKAITQERSVSEDWTQHAIECVAQHQDQLVNIRDWHEQGNTIFQVYMDYAPHKLDAFIEKYTPMLEAPMARQVLPRMKAWQTRSKLRAKAPDVDKPVSLPHPGI